MVRDTLRAWSSRQWAAVAVGTPVLAAALVAAAGVPRGALSAGWLALAVLGGLLSAGVLGSYVPRGGRRPEPGCAPCAVLPVATVVGALVAVNTYGPALVGPALAVVLTLFGLTQRLGNASRCDAAVAFPPASGSLRREGRRAA